MQNHHVYFYDPRPVCVPQFVSDPVLFIPSPLMFVRPVVFAPRLVSVAAFSSAAPPVPASPAIVEQQTRAWVREWVLKQRLCPFAAPVAERDGALRVRVAQVRTMGELKSVFIEEVELLRAVMRRQDDATLDVVSRAKEGSAGASKMNVEDEDGDSGPESTLLVVVDSGAGWIAPCSEELAPEEQKNVAEEHSSRPPPEQQSVVEEAIARSPHPFLSNYQDFYKASWELQKTLLEDRNAADELQLVLFHPGAVHSMYELSYPAGPETTHYMYKPAEVGEHQEQEESVWMTTIPDWTGDVAQSKEKWLHEKLRREADEAASAAEGGDPTNYSIRAPYPTFHLLRERDVLAAVSAVGQVRAGEIPARNAARLREMEDVNQSWRESFEGITKKS